MPDAIRYTWRFSALIMPNASIRRATAVVLLATVSGAFAFGQAHSPPAPARSGRSQICAGRVVPQFVDVTLKAGIHFTHLAAPEKKYILESMSGGVLVVDYDRDGWPDLYFTNAPTVEMNLKGEKAEGALYHNNHDGTFTNVTAKAGVASPLLRDGRGGWRLR